MTEDNSGPNPQVRKTDIGSQTVSKKARHIVHGSITLTKEGAPKILA